MVYSCVDVEENLPRRRRVPIGRPHFKSQTAGSTSNFSPLVTRATPLSKGHGGRGEQSGEKRGHTNGHLPARETLATAGFSRIRGAGDPPAWPISSEVPPSFSLVYKELGTSKLENEIPLSFISLSLSAPPPTLEGKFFIYTINMT